MTMLSQDDLDKLVPAESRMFASSIPVQSVSSDDSSKKFGASTATHRSAQPMVR